MFLSLIVLFVFSLVSPSNIISVLILLINAWSSRILLEMPLQFQWIILSSLSIAIWKENKKEINGCEHYCFRVVIWWKSRKKIGEKCDNWWNIDWACLRVTGSGAGLFSGISVVVIYVVFLLRMRAGDLMCRRGGFRVIGGLCFENMFIKRKTSKVGRVIANTIAAWRFAIFGLSAFF